MISESEKCRFYFDKWIFASKLGENTCMFKLGCRGPVTRIDCPVRKWNEYVNWPIGNDTPCKDVHNSDFLIKWNRLLHTTRQER